ncbi:hypothetical protein C8Q78DRAFT_835819 [Trametes maxima]|nr:hypothetical protein C8Q78DRAFT_835819 [Trametes maxima]
MCATRRSPRAYLNDEDARTAPQMVQKLGWVLIQVYTVRAAVQQILSCSSTAGVKLVAQWVLELAFLCGRTRVGGDQTDAKELYVQQAQSPPPHARPSPCVAPEPNHFPTPQTRRPARICTHHHPKPFRHISRPLRLSVCSLDATIAATRSGPALHHDRPEKGQRGVQSLLRRAKIGAKIAGVGGRPY